MLAHTSAPRHIGLWARQRSQCEGGRAGASITHAHTQPAAVHSPECVPSACPAIAGSPAGTAPGPPAACRVITQQGRGIGTAGVRTPAGQHPQREC